MPFNVNNLTDYSTPQVVLSNATITSNGSIVVSGNYSGLDIIINVQNAPVGTNPTLQFFAQDLDPGNSATLIGPQTNSTVISGINQQVFSFPQSRSGLTQISWTISKTFPNTPTTTFSGVNISVIPIGTKLYSTQTIPIQANATITSSSSYTLNADYIDREIDIFINILGTPIGIRPTLQLSVYSIDPATNNPIAKISSTPIMTGATTQRLSIISNDYTRFQINWVLTGRSIPHLTTSFGGVYITALIKTYLNFENGGGGGGSFTAGGDLSGSNTSQTVEELQGSVLSAPVSSGSANKVLHGDNSGTLNWSQVNLATDVTGTLGTGNQAAQSLSGDVTGTTASATVVNLQHNPIESQSLGMSQDGYVLTWDHTIGWSAETSTGGPPSGSASGDLSGSYPNPTVAKIDGASVPAAGSLTTGNVLQVNGSSSLTYAPVNLGGGANYVTGTLPNTNQAYQNMGGDVTGTTAASTVVKIQGNPVTAQTLNSSTDGYVLTWDNTDGYWKAEPDTDPSGFTAGGDLSGTSTNQTVIGLRGKSLNNSLASIGSAQDGYVLTWDNTDGYWKALPDTEPTSLPPSGPASGDLSGSYPGPTVSKIQGNPVTAQTLGTLQDGYTLTWDNADGYWKALPDTDSSSGITQLTGDVLAGPGFGSVSSTVVAISGSTPIPITPNELQWTAGTVAPKLDQAQSTTGNGVNMVVKAQDGYTTHPANGGNLYLEGGFHNSTGTDGYVALLTGGQARLIAEATGTITITDLGTGVVHSDSSGNLTSSLIVNADVASAAAIAVSKLAVGSSAQILQNNGTPTPTWTTVSGDVSITNTGGTTVTAIQGNPARAEVEGAAQDGYVLTWKNSGPYWEAEPIPTQTATGTAGGDLSGTYPNPTVAKIQTHPVTPQALNSTTDGYVLTWDNTDGYWKAEPTSGSSPTGAAGGDLSGSYPNPTVAKIDGASVPAAGSLTTGNVLQVNGSSSLTYAPVNLAGGSNYIINNLPVTNFAPGTSGQVLMSNATPATTWTTLTSDVTVSATGVTTVNSISGSSPIPITPANLQFTVGTVTPSITQVSTSSGGGTSLTISSQTSTHGGSSGGDLTLGSGGALSATQFGSVYIKNGTTTTLTIRSMDFDSDGYSDVIGFDSSLTPQIYQFVVSSTGSAIGKNMQIIAQPGQQQSGTNANNNGGNLLLSGGDAGTGGSGAAGIAGAVVIQTGGNTQATISPSNVTLNSLAGSGSGYVAVNNSGVLSFVSGIAPSGSAGGDLSGSYPNPTVAKIQTHPVTAQTLNSSTDGYVLTWDNTDGYWKAEPASSGGSVTLNGDVVGLSSSNTVISLTGGTGGLVSLDGYLGLQGYQTTYPISGALRSTDHSGTGTNILGMEYGGVSYVGISQSRGSLLIGQDFNSTNNVVTTYIGGNNIYLGGQFGATTNAVEAYAYTTVELGSGYVNIGDMALAYPLTFTGGASYTVNAGSAVTSLTIQTTAVSSSVYLDTTAANGSVLLGWSGNLSEVYLGATNIILADVGNNYPLTFTGGAAYTITSATATTSLTMSMAQSTSGNGGPLTIKAQDGYTTHPATGGNLYLAPGIGNGGSADGYVAIFGHTGSEIFEFHGGTSAGVVLGANIATTGHVRMPQKWIWYSRKGDNSTNLETFYLDGSNNLFIGDGTNLASTNFNSTTTSNIQFAGVTQFSFQSSLLSIAAGVSAPFIKQAISTTGNGQVLTIRAQDGYVANPANGGNLVLSAGAKNSTGNDGSVILETGGNTQITVTGTSPSTTTINSLGGSGTGLVAVNNSGTLSFTSASSATGGAAHAGQNIVNFGASPGSSKGSVTVTGQTGILSGSIGVAAVAYADSTDNTADEHLASDIRALIGNIVPGASFDIICITDEVLVGGFNINWHWV